MTDNSVVPEGMTAWAGGDCAPADWHWPLSVKLRDGSIIHGIPADDLRWAHTGGRQHRAQDIIAYTASNPLSLETSDLDPITPEEDALATKAIVAMGWTRQSYDSAVRMVRVVRKEERERLLSRAQRDLGIVIRTLECNSDDVRTAQAIVRFVEQNA